MNNRNRENKPKNKAGAVIATVGAIVVLNMFSMMDEIGGLDFYFIVGLIVFLAIGAGIAGIIVAVVKLIQKNSIKEEKFSFHNKHDVHEDKVYVPLHENAPKRAYYESSDVFDNRERDKQRRISQLKVFLDNGIIEKEEYKVLLKRYESES